MPRSLEPQYEELKSDITVRVRSSYRTFKEMRTRPEERQRHMPIGEQDMNRDQSALKVSGIETGSDMKSEYCIFSLVRKTKLSHVASKSVLGVSDQVRIIIRIRIVYWTDTPNN